MRLHRFYFFRRLNYKPFCLALVLAFSTISSVSSAAKAASPDFSNDENFTCTNIKVVYARESGAELGSLNYERFTNSFYGTFGNDEPSISVYELGTKEGGYDGNSYPSPGVGIETWQRFKTSIGALISAGKTYSYGESVKEGAREAVYFINNYKKVCPNSKVVMAGYSQGAQVVSLAIQSLDPSLIFAALTFGDPKLYLPEGKLDLVSYTTPACRDGKSVYSPYRENVPDCYVYKGVLGGYVPYQPSSGYNGKLKAYCQYHDIICSAFVDPDRWYSGHASYKDTGAYTEAAKDVYNMYYGIEDKKEQNLAILFDATSSMEPFLKKYQDDAIKAAKKTFYEGGKVSLYTYGDLRERDVKKLCDFSSCTEDNIEGLIKGIETRAGKDDPESMLSASYKMMKELQWTAGARKSVLVVTDAPYHNPDLDGIALNDVINLSFEIDPVNFYVLTESETAPAYAELTGRTNGSLYTSEDESPFDSFALDSTANPLADSVNPGTPLISEVTNISLKKTSDSSLTLGFDNSGPYAVLSINDDVVGVLDRTSLEIIDVDFFKENIICLSPISDNNYRGETVCKTYAPEENIIIPKAPNTGRH